LLICRLLGKPVVWSPRGALQRWEGSTKPLAKWAWEWVCNSLIKPGRCILHVTSLQEANDSIARIPNAAVEIVPNGVDIPEALPQRDWLLGGWLHLLYIGRLHPKKGIENLLYALKTMQNENISLKICGTGDESYSSSLFDLVCRLGLEELVSFQGHVDGAEKKKAFMQADVCVVPSFTENFGMVVAEALAHGVPVIVSKGTPWSEVKARDCGLWVENSPESLAEAICYIRSKALPEMGSRGRKWMKEEFDWASVAVRTLNIYKKMIRGQLKNYEVEK
jgi:glycosyltransferase involved in cell wall biosynthesis